MTRALRLAVVPIALAEYFGNKTAGINNSYGMFNGANLFVAIRNDRLIVVDHDETNIPSYSSWCKLAATGTIPGIGWSTYGAYGDTGSGPGYFMFYSTC
ncbi:MAG: hypothetical protein E4G96_06555 [Chrysiogenales bacterium]|nr:MAG: hypothetical protein E4G96_06555 [Chrysiogenales bacterium]